MEILAAFANMFWAIIVNTFSFWRSVSEIQNLFLAAAFGVPVFVVVIVVFIIKIAKRMIK